VKPLHALVFVLLSFAASAQTSEASVAEYYLGDFDCSGETTHQSAVSAQIIEPAIEKAGEAKPTETDGVATAEPKAAEDVPVTAVQPNDENATVKSDREARN
jgi:hypothetical protein